MDISGCGWVCFSSKYFLKWVQTTSEIDYFSFIEAEQIVNHIPNIKIFTSKLGLLETINDFESEMDVSKRLSQSFLPLTYRLNVLSDEVQFLNCEAEVINILIFFLILFRIIGFLNLLV